MFKSVANLASERIVLDNALETIVFTEPMVSRRLIPDSEDACHDPKLQVNQIHHGDARALLPLIEKNSIACSVWSPPYFVGKQYEAYLENFPAWKSLLREVIRLHFGIIRPGGFLVINVADILCFPDAKMPKIQAENVDRRRSKITRQEVLEALTRHPSYNRYQLAALLGCSEQTIDRRLNGNNIRGGKHATQTRVQMVGGLIEA